MKMTYGEVDMSLNQGDNERLQRQYDAFPQLYADEFRSLDRLSIKLFYSLLPPNLEGLAVLDIGCGTGDDLHTLSAKGAKIYGVEPSLKLCDLASAANVGACILPSAGESLPFPNEQFDIIVSKWAIQSSTNPALILSEIERTMKPGGTLIILVKHPIRQYLEKIAELGHGVSYFENEIVTSRIFAGKIAVEEPTHTLQEYFNPKFLKAFVIREFYEGSEFPAAEQLNGDTYPTFFLLHAVKAST
jgi:SAM-dependent methyltransferase